MESLVLPENCQASLQEILNQHKDEIDPNQEMARFRSEFVGGGKRMSVGYMRLMSTHVQVVITSHPMPLRSTERDARQSAVADSAPFSRQQRWHQHRR